MLKRTLWFILVLFVVGSAVAGQDPPKKILILVEGDSDLKNTAMGDGRQLANLFGHFNVVSSIAGVNQYRIGGINQYDYTFYIGFHAINTVPEKFLGDVLATKKSVVWLHTGFAEFSKTHNVEKRFGFRVTQLDSSGKYTLIRSGDKSFAKDEPIINIIRISNKNNVEVLATAVNSTTHSEIPYMIRSGNLLYVADSPFASAGPSDRYLLFADLLHDILHESHEESHSAIIRIEDVNPMENSERLREIADILSERGIPFLVGVTPFYVDPGNGLRISLTDKPDVVDALKYMVQNGGTIVMHGVTHQYKGVTGMDFEFWDEETNQPIKEETVEGLTKKLEVGIQEFTKNGLYPLVWETPHYTASFQLYRTVSRFFSTAMEQRLSIENYDYSQFFPYVINNDLFGQTIYPENLGYVPLDSNKTRNEGYIRQIIAAAKTNLSVRDGFASCFFHAFIDLDLLKQLVSGIQNLGYTYIDLREDQNWVKTTGHVILSQKQTYSMNAGGKYLLEIYFNKEGEISEKIESPKRIVGTITKTIELNSAELYSAELTELKEYHPGIFEGFGKDVKNIYEKVFASDPVWKEARPVILWNHFALGAAYNDQASLAAVFRSVNITVDTIFAGQQITLDPYNVVIVPYAFINSLSEKDYDLLTAFVERGGNLITDTRNYLAEEFGLKFADAQFRVDQIYDRYFPNEQIKWRYPELIFKYDADKIDEIFCVDFATEIPLVIGKSFGSGKVIYIASMFDPHTQEGYSHYPFFLEYIRKYFQLGPIVRRENLEVYFDPGFRHSQSVEYLIQQWVKQGIRFIHVAGWHQYPTYIYDYKRLIDLAHSNGILVYLWLEPPQVSLKFWQEHPEWREKNYRDEDARSSWRYPIALTDSACLNAVLDESRWLLKAYDWDGVNLAELYFEAGQGFAEPGLFTPMHSSARKEIAGRYNINAIAIFDSTSRFFWRTNDFVRSSIVEYRIRKLEEVYNSFLSMMADIARQKEGFQIIVTAMDGYGSPELREQIGVDMNSIIALQNKYGFLLQIEDPQNRWSSDPLRYIEIGRKYIQIVGDSSKILLDLNILSFRRQREVTPFPTLIQTGTESFHLVRAASLGAPRLTIYSESSINPQDIRYFPYALASEVRYQREGNTYHFSSPYSFVLRFPRDIEGITVDGQPLGPIRDNHYLIPAGDHTVIPGVDPSSSFSTHQIQPRLMSFSGNLMTIAYGMRSIQMDYLCPSRALVSLNSQPTSVKVDGVEYPVDVRKGNDCYSMYLPPGRHSAEILTGDMFSYGINLTSLWSSTAIALFGATAIITLLGMYLYIQITRRNASCRKGGKA
jgi:uncharacterized protein YdaL